MATMTTVKTSVRTQIEGLFLKKTDEVVVKADYKGSSMISDWITGQLIAGMLLSGEQAVSCDQPYGSRSKSLLPVLGMKSRRQELIKAESKMHR